MAAGAVATHPEEGSVVAPSVVALFGGAIEEGWLDEKHRDGMMRGMVATVASGRRTEAEVLQEATARLAAMKKNVTKQQQQKQKQKQKHANLKEGELSRGSTWGAVAGGRLAASGAPGKGALERWRSLGADTVVTLQRLDETGSSGSIGARCAAAGLEWVHLPLAGKRALSDPDEHDARSLAAAAGLGGRLKCGASMVVHCSAGMHRTGMMCYLVMRHAGLGVDEAMETLERMRPVTHREVATVPQSRGVSLQEEAEQLFLAGKKNKKQQQRPREKHVGAESGGDRPARAMAPDRLAADTVRILKAGKYSVPTAKAAISLDPPRLAASYRSCRTVIPSAAAPASEQRGQKGSGSKRGGGGKRGGGRGGGGGTRCPPAVTMEVFEGDSFDAALMAAEQPTGQGGDLPCVLDFASDSNPGGGWRSKQQGTQEESLCRRSSLGVCLEEHYKRVGHAKYMPANAVVYCPEVVVFRGSSRQGGGLLPAKPAWVSVAAAALREAKDEAEIRRKVDGVLRTMADHGKHRTVILGAWGCGAFGNSTGAVARQMVAAVKEGGAEFPLRVVFAVPDKQKAAVFRKALQASCAAS